MTWLRGSLPLSTASQDFDETCMLELVVTREEIKVAAGGWGSVYLVIEAQRNEVGEVLTWSGLISFRPAAPSLPSPTT